MEGKLFNTINRLGTTMSKVSADLTARARNELTRVLQALSSSNQGQLA